MKKTELSKEEMKDLVKSVYKSILKTLKDKKDKQDAKDVVEDVLDPNHVAEVDPDEVPSVKDKILYKKDAKSSKSHEKGVKKLKKMCDKMAVKKSKSN